MNAMWSMTDNEKRSAIIARAANGARRALAGRDVLQVSSSAPVAAQTVPSILTVPANSPTWRHVIYEVAQKHGIGPQDILSDYRGPHIVAARHEVFWRLRTELKFGWRRIGLVMGRDASTVRHGVNCHAGKMGQAS